jgi:hypothetical protein
VNLTSLELADCIVEFSQLSQEVTGGLRAGSRSIKTYEKAVRAGGKALQQAFKEVVLPGLQERVKATGGVILVTSLVHRFPVKWRQNVPSLLLLLPEVLFLRPERGEEGGTLRESWAGLCA